MVSPDYNIYASGTGRMHIGVPADGACLCSAPTVNMTRRGPLVLGEKDKRVNCAACRNAWDGLCKNTAVKPPPKTALLRGARVGLDSLPKSSTGLPGPVVDAVGRLMHDAELVASSMEAGGYAINARGIRQHLRDLTLLGFSSRNE